jgi:glucose-6-phosphate isomerase
VSPAVTRSLLDTDGWREVLAHHEWLRSRHLRELFADDPDRGRRLVVQAGDLRIDYSKHRVTDETLRLLVAAAEELDLAGKLEEVFAGRPVNVTEQRAALHTALRLPEGSHLDLDGTDVVPMVHDVLMRMGRFADRVRSGAWVGSTGKPIHHVVNIGIGGSDLGPKMAAVALRTRVSEELDLHFVSNVDGDDLNWVLQQVEPESTLFIVCSKTFTTLETLTNAHTAKAWLQSKLGDRTRIDRHFVAVSTNADAVGAFGIDVENMFEFWDWVGGRFSVGSAIGLSLMVGLGPGPYEEFLAGFHAIDTHVRSTPLADNAAVLMGLIGIWYRNLFNAQTLAVLPYADTLARFPAYLQQLEMESNGKRVQLDGSSVQSDTAPVVWGEPGTNGQHAFYQLLHQGTTLVPCDFIGFAHAADEPAPAHHHDLLVANLLAQAEALAFGRTATEVAQSGIDERLVPHRTFVGNVPSTTILAPQLTPNVLGQLIALYEHKIVVQGLCWGINSFDQWGVELGKALASTIAEELATGEPRDHDSSTTAMLEWYRQNR